MLQPDSIRCVSTDIEKLRLFVSAPAGVDFLLDTSSLKVIISDPDWKTKAHDRIQEIRTSPFTVTVNINDEVYNPKDITIQVRLYTSSRGFVIWRNRTNIWAILILLF